MKIALPKGRLLRKTAAMLQKAGWGLDEYHSNMGFYRPRSEKFPDVLIRVFHEKDIPIQIAMGNYDLGVCCLDWIEELLVKYPSSDLVKVQDLMYGDGALYIAATSLPGDLRQNGTPVRIASEYPNLAEAFALRKRMSRFSVFPVWGAAEAYPPENADMVLLSAKAGAELAGYGMVPVSKMLDFSAFLIANKNSWETKNFDKLVTSICDTLAEVEKKSAIEEKIGLTEISTRNRTGETAGDTVRLALPDGHQQQPTVSLLNRAGIEIDDYPSETGNRRPKINIDDVTVKVIRPQDMPLQVANGNFDLAITGRDWLTEHLDQFPSSPVKELLDLKSSKVRIVAVVSRELQVDDTGGLRQLIAAREEPFRVASEYVNIADKYARDNHLGQYRVIPTWGATEAFLPEDADLLIENTETGRTIARHNLKIIDTLFESTSCLIGNTNSVSAPKGKRIEAVVQRLRAAVEDV
ncbi:MAG: ATP phosphoribosyltransferase [Dehalococcoidales bacterium]|nr:ATP phosphoribosyltransferase [Dehalococcoidales bacterium]